MGVAGMLWSSVIAGSLQFLLLCGWAFHQVPIRFDWLHLKRMLDFGIPLIASNLSLFVLNFSDRFFLQHLRSLDVVGVYAVGYKFGYMMNYLVVQPFFVMWQSRMYAIHARPEHPAIFRQFFSMYSLGMIYTGLAMSLFSPEVVAIMVRPKFAASQDIIPLVALAYIFYGLAYYAQLGILLSEKPGSLGLIGTISAVLNLVLNYFLISHFGMTGAAWATVLSFAFMMAANSVISQRMFHLRLGFGRMAGGLVLAIAIYILCRWCFPEPGFAAMTVKLCALAVFPVVIWKSGILIPGAAASVSSAGDAALTALWRMCAGFPRRAV
jgi:O-antigen/teichoic acid export membrane protein